MSKRLSMMEVKHLHCWLPLKAGLWCVYFISILFYSILATPLGNCGAPNLAASRLVHMEKLGTSPYLARFNVKK